MTSSAARGLRAHTPESGRRRWPVWRASGGRRPGARPRSIALCAVALAALAGCGGSRAPLADPAPPHWASASLSPEPVVLRRSHRVGDRLVSCVVGEERVWASPAPEPHVGTYAAISEIEVVEATAGGPFGARFASSAATGFAAGPGVAVDLTASPELTHFDAQNRAIAAAPRPPARPPSSGPAADDVDHTALPLLPDLSRIFDPTFPDAALAVGESFEHHTEATAYEEGAPPVRSELDVRWTYLGAESSAGVRYAHVSCVGTFTASFAVTASDGEHAEGRMNGRIACRARFDLATGFAGEVRVVTHSDATTSHARPGEARRDDRLSAETSFDVTRAQNVGPPETVPLCASARGVLDARR